MIDQSRNNLTVRALRASFFFLMRILFRIEYHGMENIPAEGPLIITPNHVTYFDPFWIGVRVYRTARFMTWDKPLNIPIAGPILRWFGAFPVSLENPESGAYRASLKVLQNEEALVIFPEGGRSPDGKLLPFKEGAARLALKTGATILPVVVLGGARVWSPQMRLPRPAKVRIEFLPSIPCPKLRTKSKEEFELAASEVTEQIRRVIEARLESGPRSKVQRPTSMVK